MRNAAETVTSENAEHNLSSTLIIDLDHTLSKSDTLSDLLALVILKRPVKALIALLVLIFKGRARLKRALVNEIDLLNAKSLNYNEDLIDYIKSQRANGRNVWLVSASSQELLDQVGAHLELFDRVVGTQSTTNLKGENKLAYLLEHCPDGFSYIGDCGADLPIWNESQSIGIVASQRRIERLRKLVGKQVEFTATHPRSSLFDWLRQLRLHQWSKNVLVFLPMFLAHQFTLRDLALSTIAFVIFGFVASATYIINDILDIDADRNHPTKKNRPIAAGKIDAVTGLMFAIGTLVIFLCVAFIQSPTFFAVVAAYLVTTLWYSFRLKKIPLLDVFVIGLLFSARLAGGAFILSIDLSNWLIAFSMFLFPSLALAKRQGELMRSKISNSEEPLLGRGYHSSDSELTLTIGVAGSMGALLLLMLYITNLPAHTLGLYMAPHMLWLTPMILMLWLGRIWLLAHRGILKDDPVAFAVKDKTSLAMAGFLGLVFILASFGPALPSLVQNLVLHS